MYRIVIILAFMVLLPFSVFAESNSTLVLVYKDIGKPPFMEVAPDCSGLYKDLMTRAAQKIGFELEVVRGPKKRLYGMLERGLADLYASGLFRESRVEFLFYMPNGLHTHKQHYGLTSLRIPQIKKLSDINVHDLYWVVELGSSKPGKAKQQGVNFQEVKKISVDKAVQLLKRERPFFFLINSADVNKYMSEKQLVSMSEVGVRLHICTPKVESPLFSCFSRRSPYYQEEPNPNFDSSKPVSYDNFPVRLVPGSVPYKFNQALQEMIEDGEVEALGKKYFAERWQDVVICNEPAFESGKEISGSMN